MINWKETAKIEYRYGLKLYQEYHECEEELNRHEKPNGAEARPLARADIVRTAREWAHIVQSLEAEVVHERMAYIKLYAECEGWKDEALAARRRASLETPIADLSLADTWRVEKQAYMDEIAQMKAQLIALGSLPVDNSVPFDPYGCRDPYLADYFDTED